VGDGDVSSAKGVRGGAEEEISLREVGRTETKRSSERWEKKRRRGREGPERTSLRTQQGRRPADPKGVTYDEASTEFIVSISLERERSLNYFMVEKPPKWSRGWGGGQARLRTEEGARVGWGRLKREEKARARGKGRRLEGSSPWEEGVTRSKRHRRG